MFLPIEGKSTLNEKILWEWNITKEISDDTISYTCTFLLSLIDSEIELSLPATCHYKDVEM
jgi:hypothetical protein